MNKEQKVTSLELSKKIYELTKKKGIKLESEYYWWIDTIKDEYTREPELSDTVPHHLREYIEIYPALDTAELGEMLPYGYISDKTDYKEIEKKWCCGNFHTLEAGHGETEVEARGQMYFYLLDNNLL